MTERRGSGHEDLCQPRGIRVRRRAGVLASGAFLSGVEEGGPDRPREGREALAAVIGGIWGDFSDVHWELGGPVVANGKRAAFPVAIRMTHDGPMPMPDGSVIDPTGEKVSFTSAVSWALDTDGLVADERSNFDATAIA